MKRIIYIISPVMHMRINVKVTPNAKRPMVLRIDDGNYRVKVDARAVEGKANDRLTELLAEHFGVSRSRVRIIRGVGSRNKVIEVSA
jgi:hypothetical protein